MFWMNDTLSIIYLFTQRCIINSAGLGLDAPQFSKCGLCNLYGLWNVSELKLNINFIITKKKKFIIAYQI